MLPSPDLPPALLSLLLAPFGLILGSFANVLIHRLPLEAPEDRNVVTKPSHCPSCQARIRPWHNVPLLGWLVLRGRCAACGWRIPLRYPLVELLGGLILAGSVWVFPMGTLIWAKGVICAYALLVLFFTDLTEFILPDAIQFPLMVLGLAFTLPQLLWPEHGTPVALGGWQVLRVDTFFNGLQPAPAWTLLGGVVTWKESLIGLVAGYGVPWCLANGYVLLNNQVFTRLFHKERLEESMGMGDFKMLAWIGAFWGWHTMLGVLALGVLMGGLLAILAWTFRKADGRTLLPFGCPLALGVPIAVFYGRALWEGYLGIVWR
jgi:leader peptidase (prepilin peptidase) / N-methyltransferase